MTPTEQDKELRNILSQLMKDGITNTRADDPPQGRKMLLDNAVVAIKQLITADRKRVALEARINELHKALDENSPFGEGQLDIASEYAEYRIAELKAQQEKV